MCEDYCACFSRRYDTFIVFCLFSNFFLVFRESDAVIVRSVCEGIKSSYFKFIYTMTAQFISHEKRILFAVIFHFAEKR